MDPKECGETLLSAPKYKQIKSERISSSVLLKQKVKPKENTKRNNLR